MDSLENIMAIKKNLGVTEYTNHSIDFALTTYCQAKCRSCARTNEQTGEKESWLQLKHMDLDVFRRTLESSPNVHIADIEFCGEFGDPMMHPQIDKFIETALEFAPSVRISTNGGLRTPDWYESIAKKYKNRLEINFAIDGATHDVKWMYREGVDWHRAIDNINSYMSAGGRGSWWFIIFEWNWHQIPEANSLANDIGIDLMVRYNNRDFGLITPESQIKADAIIKEHGL
jgi:molybdenum cofactor biosynthesis enzyme MoaA